MIWLCCSPEITDLRLLQIYPLRADNHFNVLYTLTNLETLMVASESICLDANVCKLTNLKTIALSEFNGGHAAEYWVDSVEGTSY